MLKRNGMDARIKSGHDGVELGERACCLGHAHRAHHEGRDVIAHALLLAARLLLVSRSWGRLLLCFGSGVLAMLLVLIAPLAFAVIVAALVFLSGGRLGGFGRFTLRSGMNLAIGAFPPGPATTPPPAIAPLAILSFR